MQPELEKPLKWIKTINRKTTKPKIKWKVDKEAIYENYPRKFYRIYKFNKEEEVYEIERIKFDGTKLPEKYHSIELLLPNGKIVTPIRQFCETKVLPPRTKEAFFYDLDKIILLESMEGKAPELRKSSANYGDKSKSLRGTKIDLAYTEVNETPLQLVSAINRAFALEAISDENQDVLDRCVNEAKLPHWINYQGVHIANDEGSVSQGKLTLRAIMTAKGIIEDEGLYAEDVILATSGKAIRDLMFDKEFDSYVKLYKEKYLNNTLKRPDVIDQPFIERMLGIKIFKTSAVSQKGITRSILFLPNVSFGLVTGRELEFEAKRLKRKQIISVTGTKRTVGVLKNPETIVRISHA